MHVQFILDVCFINDVIVNVCSRLSLDEAAAGFSRDAFGRQSMSEKRHATLDAKNTDTYQRNKKLREEREKQRHEELVSQGSKCIFIAECLAL